MIHYQLQCANGHEFDGWFKSSASFDRQAARHLLECPSCGTNAVERAIMAPRIGGKSRAPAETPPDPTPPAAHPSPTPPATAITGPMPAEMRALLARVRREVEAKCDYVGPAFAAEARRIHDGEAEPRGIYGEATEAEAEALAEDGITVGRIPWVPLADS
ncbi:DUF1178 family protein [Acidiphilium sp. PA]|uniref:DUF1178 family protein n=1 Tax=Acidiphilium sp. PA TaxID=2871705 RepID=UPI0022430629|nr:DUF1178 family protein [Acidiphilium sp. PA]MCW8305766.1 DUF1178 family protein [Acidiphilium sp. PA]